MNNYLKKENSIHLTSTVISTVETSAQVSTCRQKFVHSKASFFSEIGAAFRELGDDPDCRVVVMSGNGKLFCSGLLSCVYIGVMGMYHAANSLVVTRKQQLILSSKILLSFK